MSRNPHNWDILVPVLLIAGITTVGALTLTGADRTPHPVPPAPEAGVVLQMMPSGQTCKFRLDPDDQTVQPHWTKFSYAGICVAAPKHARYELQANGQFRSEQSVQYTVTYKRNLPAGRAATPDHFCQMTALANRAGGPLGGNHAVYPSRTDCEHYRPNMRLKVLEFTSWTRPVAASKGTR